MLIAQISDLHVSLPGGLAYGRVDTAGMFGDCVAAVNRLDPRPDLVVITGDLVDLGRPEEYAYLRTILEPLGAPLVVIPGNHDDREAMRAAFSDCAYLPAAGFLHFTLEDYPLRIVGLDTVTPGEGGGEMCAERLSWFESALSQRPAAPTLVLMHHAPFVTGIGHMDEIGLAGKDEFASVLARHPQVELVLCGHLHRTIHARVGGRPVLTCPSPAHQVDLDLKPAAPACFRMEPPGFMLHRWQDGALVSHVACVGAYAGPFPFYGDGGQSIE